MRKKRKYIGTILLGFFLFVMVRQFNHEDYACITQSSTNKIKCITSQKKAIESLFWTTTTTTTTSKAKPVTFNALEFSDDPTICRISEDLGPIWKRSGFNDLESWKLHIKYKFQNTSFTELLRLHPTDGGAWKPKDCNATATVAIIIPFRNRSDHLRLLLKILHPLLQRQQIDYEIFVIEQGDNSTVFNKGKLMNVGFLTAVSTRPDIECFFFHDVDLIPEDERTMYRCNETGPKHYGAMVDTLGYKPMYYTMVGGIVALTKEQFVAINGYSNIYWGWGGEDDDFGLRIEAAGFPIISENTTNTIYHFTMLNHETLSTNPNPKRWALMAKAKQQFRQDGLESVLEKGFSVESLVKEEDSTHVVVDVKKEA